MSDPALRRETGRTTRELVDALQCLVRQHGGTLVLDAAEAAYLADCVDRVRGFIPTTALVRR